MTFDDVADDLEQAAALLASEVPYTLQRSLELLKDAAQAQSRGPLQPADLARLGHPYSRVRSTTLNPNIVNRVKGDFEAGWVIDPPRPGPNVWDGSVSNNSPQAEELEQGLVFGRPLMVPRHPEVDAAAKAVAPIEALWNHLLDRVAG